MASRGASRGGGLASGPCRSEADREAVKATLRDPESLKVPLTRTEPSLQPQQPRQSKYVKAPILAPRYMKGSFTYFKARAYRCQ